MSKTNIIFQKKKIRQEVLKEIKKYSDSQLFRYSEHIFQTLEKKEYFQKANIILAYWSIPGEVYTHDFIIKWYHSKTILLPVINKDNLDIKLFQGKDKMARSRFFYVMEPKGKLFTDYSSIDLVIIPGIAFDKSNNRLGRGQGYYDRLLPALNAYKIGVCFNFQLFDNIPSQQTDIKMDEVITQEILK